MMIKMCAFALFSCSCASCNCPVVTIAGRNKRTALSDPLTSAFMRAMAVNGLSSSHKSPTHATLGLLNVPLKASSNTGSLGKALLWERRMRRVMAQEGEKKNEENTLDDAKCHQHSEQNGNSFTARSYHRQERDQRDRRDCSCST